MLKKKYALLAALMLFFLTGCGEQRVLEDLGLIHTASYDLLPKEERKSGNELLITLSVPKTDPESRKAAKEMLTTKAANIKGGRINLSRQTELSLVSGQMRNILLGSSLARKGVWPIMDTLQRDPSISQRLKVTVVEGNAHELLVKNYTTHSRTGRYIERMLEKEMRARMTPQVTLYDFTRDFFDDGIDPVAPLLTHNNDHVTIEGIALFNEDRYVAKIPASDVLIFAFLHGNFKQGEISIDFGEVTDESNNSVMFTSLISKRRIQVFSNRAHDDLTVHVHMQIKGSVLEYDGKMDLSKASDRRKLERVISENITERANEMVAKMQKVNADSIGVGKQVRNRLNYRAWKNLNWEETYPDVKVRCTAEMVIKDHGKFK